MIGHLLDHTARVWTLNEQLDDYRVSTRSYSVLEGNDNLPFTATRKQTVIGKVDPGVGPIGERRGYFDIGPEVKERDVIEVFEGPDAPAYFQVESVARPRGHHIEMRLSEYKGKIPLGELGS